MPGNNVIKNRIYIGRLPDRARESDLEKFLRGYGDIKEIRMMTGYAFVEFEEDRDAEDAVYELNGKSINGENVTVDYATVPRNSNRGRSPGYSSRRRYDDDDRGYDRRDRGRDRRDRDGYDRYDKYDDRNRRAPGADGYYGPLNKSPYRLIVKNLSVAVSWQDLKDFMRRAGDVTFCSCHQQKRNEGVAEFGDKESLDKALDELDGSEIHGMKIRLYHDKPGGSRSRSKSRSRSNSRSRSRSPKRSKRSRSRRRSGSKDSKNSDKSGDDK